VQLYPLYDKSVDAAVKERRRLEAVEKDVKTLPNADELAPRISEALQAAAAIREAVGKLAAIDTLSLTKEVRATQTKIAQIEKLPDADQLLTDAETAVEKKRAFDRVLDARGTLGETFGEDNIAKFKETRKLLDNIAKLDPLENYQERIADAAAKGRAVEAASRVDIDALKLTLAGAKKLSDQVLAAEARAKVLLDAQVEKVAKLAATAENVKTGIANLEARVDELRSRITDNEANGVRTQLSESLDQIDAQVIADTAFLRKSYETMQQSAQLQALATALKKQAETIVQRLPRNPSASMQVAFDNLTNDVTTAFATFASTIERRAPLASSVPPQDPQNVPQGGKRPFDSADSTTDQKSARTQGIEPDSFEEDDLP
jgi:hypothetical protein